MDEKIKAEIVQYANEFRTAVETAQKHNEFSEFNPLANFPFGCCGIASELLAAYLLERGIKSTVGFGWSIEPNSSSHAWLIVDGVIVDITGDQFNDDANYNVQNPRVYVGGMDYFHELFQVYDYKVQEFVDFINKEDIFSYNKVKKYLKRV